MERRPAGLDEYRFRRRNLPHWEIAGLSYFVTFRLAHSLPAHVVEEWRRERERLQRQGGEPGTALVPRQPQRASCPDVD